MPTQPKQLKASLDDSSEQLAETRPRTERINLKICRQFLTSLLILGALVALVFGLSPMAAAGPAAIPPQAAKEVGPAIPLQSTAHRGVVATSRGSNGLPRVRVFDSVNLSLAHDFLVYTASFTGGVRIALGDVNGDTQTDIVTGAGPGGTPHIRVFDGVSGTEIYSFLAYSAAFTGGVFVAAGDINGDRRADIVTGTGAGSGAHVKVFDGATLGLLHSFFAYSVMFTGDVFVAASDINGDGRADLITGTDAGTGPEVKVFDGETLSVIHHFFAYSAAFTGGVRVAAGDVNGDGRADIVTGVGAGAAPHLKVFNGLTQLEIHSFFADDVGFNGGIFVAAAPPPVLIHLPIVVKQ
jgi:hypothetical protein